MKTLVTHFRPHLDDICAMWLMKRYLPDCQDAKLGFISTGPKGAPTGDDPSFVYIGVGRGQFDEHKGDIGKCATSLVFDFVKENVLLGPMESRALQKIVDWVLLEDTGKLNTIEHRDFTIPVLIELFPAGPESDAHVTEFGFAILDSLLVVQRNAVHVEDDWANRIEFDSRYGKAVGFNTDARKIDTYAYAKGFDTAVIVDPDMSYHAVRANATAQIDLTPALEALKKADPEASWYFHHSKKLIICGGDHSPDTPRSKLTLEQMIALVK